MAGKNKNAVASSDPKSYSPQENIWLLLRKANEKIARMGDNSDLSPILERIYDNARTHFNKTQQMRTDVKWKKEDNLRNQPRRLPAKDWPAPPALTFAFFEFPPPDFFFVFRKKSGLSGRLSKRAETAGFFYGRLGA